MRRPLCILGLAVLLSGALAFSQEEAERDLELFKKIDPDQIVEEDKEVSPVKEDQTWDNGALSVQSIEHEEYHGLRVHLIEVLHNGKGQGHYLWRMRYFQEDGTEVQEGHSMSWKRVRFGPGQSRTFKSARISLPYHDVAIEFERNEEFERNGPAEEEDK